MPHDVRPHTPPATQFRVKAAYRGFVAERFGVMYAHAKLARRELAHEHAPHYAPVALTPGYVRVFTWPAIELRREWLELVNEFGDPYPNVHALQRA